jgi:UDP-N-acetylmuramoylalanine--D-glutamate ligase
LDGTKIVAAFDGQIGGVQPGVTEILDISHLLIPGAHNVENVMAAASLCIALGVPVDVIREVSESFDGVEHRIEFVREVGGVKFYNDSKATNTDSAIKGLLAMKGDVVLIGGGYDKDADFGEWVRLFKENVKRLVLIGATAGKIAETCGTYGFSDYDVSKSLKEAVELAFSKALPGDSVLLSPACASFDMFKDYEERGERFKEYVIAL